MKKCTAAPKINITLVQVDNSDKEDLEVHLMNKKLGLLLLSLLLISFAKSTFAMKRDIYNSFGFEGFEIGHVLTTRDDGWTANNLAGQVIVDGEGLDGSKCLKIPNINDNTKYFGALLPFDACKNGHVWIDFFLKWEMGLGSSSTFTLYINDNNRAAAKLQVSYYQNNITFSGEVVAQSIPNTWQRYTIDLNLDSNKASFYLDGQLIKEDQPFMNTDPNGIYSVGFFGKAHNTYNFYLDEFSVGTGNPLIEQTADANNSSIAISHEERPIGDDYPITVTVNAVDSEGNNIVAQKVNLKQSNGDFAKIVPLNFGFTDENGMASFLVSSQNPLVVTLQAGIEPGPVLLEPVVVEFMSINWGKLVELTNNPISLSASGGRGNTVFKMSLKRDSNITLTLYDSKGRFITTFLKDIYSPAGYYGYTWDGTIQGRKVKPGLYYYRLFVTSVEDGKPFNTWESGALAVIH